jgi:hypothetical protein
LVPSNKRNKAGKILYVGPCGCCGTEATVPFKATHKPALCADCHRLPPTPDFLLLDGNVTINRHVVRWIDCKYFYGSCSAEQQSLRTQALKYSNRYGPGAFIFAFEFCLQLEIPNVLILDAGIKLDMTDIGFSKDYEPKPESDTGFGIRDKIKYPKYRNGIRDIIPGL